MIIYEKMNVNVRKFQQAGAKPLPVILPLPAYSL
jgi:hypothetical protein